MNHTPTPWDYSASGLISGDLRNDGDDSTDVAYCNMEGAVGRIGGLANAALIVKSVNAHDELVAALRECTEGDLSDVRALAKALHENNHRVTGTEAERISSLLRTMERTQRFARAVLAKVQS